MSWSHPLPVGTRVYHSGQRNWACTLEGGTGEIVEVMGPYRDGAYEYIVLVPEDFSRRASEDNPETRQTQWASYRTVKAFEGWGEK